MNAVAQTPGLAAVVAKLNPGDRVRVTFVSGNKFIGNVSEWRSGEKILLLNLREAEVVVRRIDGTPGRCVAHVERWDVDHRYANLRQQFADIFQVEAELAACTTSEMGPLQLDLAERENAIKAEWIEAAS